MMLVMRKTGQAAMRQEQIAVMRKMWRQLLKQPSRNLSPTTLKSLRRYFFRELLFFELRITFFMITLLRVLSFEKCLFGEGIIVLTKVFYWSENELKS